MPILASKHRDGRTCILVATDFSDASKTAVLLGAKLAERASVRLHLLHVVDMGEHPLRLFFESADALRERVDEDAQERLTTFAAEVLGDVTDVDLTVKFGHPVDDIVGVGGHDNVAIIIMGTTGGGRFENAIFGSTAARVVRESRKPVLMVPVGSATEPAKTILAPVDFSEMSKRGLLAAARLARSNGAKVLALNVMTMPPLSPYYPAAPPPSPKLLQTLAEERKARIEGLVEELDVSDVVTILPVEHSEAVEDAILENTQAHDIDLICLGSHSRKGLERLILGSTAEKVLREARIPVLVISE